MNPGIRLLLFSIVLLSACTEKNKLGPLADLKSEEVQIFERIPSQVSGLTFNNEVIENEKFNHIFYVGIFQGAGVAVGDINNDGLQDVYFAGNMVPDKLFLNKGDLQFEDITAKSRIIHDNKWSTGVAMADVNNDGWLDIYVCKFLLDDPQNRENALYINNGDLTFRESAKASGVADNGFSTMANFFDYDKDGDLDLYVGNEPPSARQSRDVTAEQADFSYTDRLYQNQGDGTFKEVTKEAGLLNHNYTLSVTVADVDNDSWPDIYVASDFEEPDFFYHNNGNGTFTNIIHSAMRHLSTYSMGTDIADINNDGLLDFYTADMVAPDNQRLKSNMSGMNPEKFWNLANHGYHYQYMFNTLQLNNGNGTFSEIAQMAGVSNTDWSWSTLLADFDNDGYRDLMVTNGMRKDIRNNDYSHRRKEVLDSLAEIQRLQGLKPQVNVLKLIELAPSKKLQNYVFRNNGDLTFANQNNKWGFTEPTWSHGAAYADFDQDGDIDLLINNMNEEAFLFKNVSVEKRLNNFLELKLTGAKPNKNAIGARVTIHYGNEIQVSEVSPVRGYFSQSEALIHFGLGKHETVDKIEIRWPDGQYQELNNQAANQVLKITQSGSSATQAVETIAAKPVFEKIFADTKGLDFQHVENDFNDFDREILLPHKMSNLGPALAAADINADGKEDLFFGGASGQAGQLYLQNPDGSFTAGDSDVFAKDKKSEDVDALFFDADGDGDSDLYVVSGGNDFQKNDPSLQDRLYLNDGKGGFTKSTGKIPEMIVSGGCVKAGDFDQDGDLDLFVGGKQVPGFYGESARSFLLENNKGKFTDATPAKAKEMTTVGMVSDAIWTDFDGDKDLDLIVVGEWMPVTFFQNNQNSFNDITADVNMENSNGWWNAISEGDFDGDGDMDYVIGNLGFNIKYKASEKLPFKAYIKDFDNNGTHDVYLAYYDTDGVCYPVRGRQCSSQQLPFIKKEFSTYGKFSVASVDQVLGDRKEGALVKEAKIFASVYMENENGQSFSLHPLPNQAQISPIFAIIPADWNHDGQLDILSFGNYYQREVETTRSDAGIGCLLLGDGKGGFQPVPPVSSGLSSFKDARKACLVSEGAKPFVVVANNNDKPDWYFCPAGNPQ